MKPMVMSRLNALVGLALLCSGCMVDVRHDYQDVMPTLGVSGTGKLVVAVHDQRPYVVSGNVPPEFVGLSRNVYGRPFSVRTESIRPLAEDMTRVLCKAINDQGFYCMPVVVAERAPAAEVQLQLREVTGDLWLLLVLHEWKSSTAINTALTYDVTFNVLDKAGAVLARVNRKGVEQLGGDILGPPGHARIAIPPVFKQTLEGLLQHPDVVAAVKSVSRG